MKLSLNHINDADEKRFVKMMLEYSKRSEQQFRPIFTDFYNKEWLLSMIDRYIEESTKQMCYFYGGFEEAERQVLGIAPYEIQEEDFPIMALELKVKTGIGKALTHRDYLGALLGLGIERETIGDIVIKPFGAYIIANESMVSYINSNLLSIGKYQNIEHQVIPFSQLQINPPQIKSYETTVASLRLDVIVAAGFGLSRGVCTKLIQADRVKCNGVTSTNKQLIKEGDHITVRGYGKIKLKQISGLTKKDRIHITIEKYV